MPIIGIFNVSLILIFKPSLKYVWAYEEFYDIGFAAFLITPQLNAYTQRNSGYFD